MRAGLLMLTVPVALWAMTSAAGANAPGMWLVRLRLVPFFLIALLLL